MTTKVVIQTGKSVQSDPMSAHTKGLNKTVRYGWGQRITGGRNLQRRMQVAGPLVGPGRRPAAVVGPGPGLCIGPQRGSVGVARRVRISAPF